VGGAGGLCGCGEDARTDALDGEVYTSGGVEEVAAGVGKGLIYTFGGLVSAFLLY
jgi:hypothetical protein